MSFDPSQLIKSKEAQKAFNSETVTRAKRDLDGICLFGKVKRVTMDRALDNLSSLERDTKPHVQLWQNVQDFFAGKGRS